MFKFIPPDTRYDFSIVMENGQALLYAANGELVEYEVAKYIADCIVNSHYPTEYIYVGRAYGDRFKVGFSNDPARRAKELGVTLVHIIPCQGMRQLSARTTEKAIHSLLTKLGRHLEGEWFRLNFSALNFIELLKSSEDVQTFMSDYRRFSFVRDNVKKELDSFERRSSQYFSWIEASIKEDKESFTFALSPILDYLIEDFAHYKAIDNQQAALLEQQIEQLLKENISEVAAAYWMASVRTGMTEFERIRLEWITD